MPDLPLYLAGTPKQVYAEIQNITGEEFTKDIETEIRRMRQYGFDKTSVINISITAGDAVNTYGSVLIYNAIWTRADHIVAAVRALSISEAIGRLLLRAIILSSPTLQQDQFNSPVA